MGNAPHAGKPSVASPFPLVTTANGDQNATQTPNKGLK